MSHVEVYKVTASGDVVSVATVENHHAYAPLIWDAFMRRYGYRNEKVDLHDDPGLRRMYDECCDGVGPWATETDYRERERLLLVSTFGCAWVARDLVPDLARAMREFDGREVRGDMERTVVRVADVVEDVVTDESVRGVAFQVLPGDFFWKGYGPDRPRNVDSDQPGVAWELGTFLRAARESASGWHDVLDEYLTDDDVVSTERSGEGRVMVSLRAPDGFEVVVLDLDTNARTIRLTLSSAVGVWGWRDRVHVYERAGAIADALGYATTRPDDVADARRSGGLRLHENTTIKSDTVT